MGKKLALIAVALMATALQGHRALSAPPAKKNPPPAGGFKDVDEFVEWVQKFHKAPFERESARLDTKARAEIAKRATAPALVAAAATAASKTKTNVKVNQDRNPWPKAEIGAAVDPVTGNYLVMENDFREGFDHMFFHVSTNGGKSWTDDSMTPGLDPFTGDVPFDFQSDPGLAFDSKGHSVLTTIAGNLSFDFLNGVENFDSQVELTLGFNHGTYANLVPLSVDTQPCSFNFTTGTSTCAIQLDKPFVTVDNVPGSASNGTIYVYYTAFCVQDVDCVDGDATFPPFTSVILESHAAAAGLPFSPPKLVSGTFNQAQFSSMVIDSKGRPHIFFDDFSDGINAVMHQSSFDGTTWTVHAKPIATINNLIIASPNWGFRIDGTIAPGCAINKDTAYCAFSASQVNGGKLETSSSVYLATVKTGSGSSSVVRVNNDIFGGSKDHFFPWAATKTDGSVYVGWYDDRNDPFNTKVEYFVGKSTDGGKTFPTQKAVSDVSFNPCDGFPGCGFFGDYTQLVSGADNVVHAQWSDTRDGASMQVFSQVVPF
jgi:hypothetical protein